MPPSVTNLVPGFTGGNQPRGMKSAIMSDRSVPDFAGQGTTRLIECKHSVEPTCVDRVRRRHTGIAVGPAVPTRNRRENGYRTGRLFPRVYLSNHAVQNRKAPPAGKRHWARAWSDTHAGNQRIEMESSPPTNKAVAQLMRSATARTKPLSCASFPLKKSIDGSPTRYEADSSTKMDACKAPAHQRINKINHENNSAKHPRGANKVP